VSIFGNKRHKLVTTATYFEQAVATRNQNIFMKPTYPSIFPKSLPNINPGILVETSETCVF